MRLLVCVICIALSMSGVTVSRAAIIGPKDDWIDIEAATKPCPEKADPHLACGLSRRQVDAILRAGLGFGAPAPTMPIPSL